MEDLSLHILDIAENSVAAKADKIEIRITEDKKKDLLSVEVIDNGLGMDKETLDKALDPFYTSKIVRRFGFGLSLLSEAAKAANGHFSIQSKKGEGTRIKADFQHSHIDRQPMGDIGQSILTLIIGNPEINFLFEHKRNDHTYCLDTRKIRTQLKGMPINSLAGIKIIRENLKKIQKSTMT
ncbi:MAG: ATP-binding protein [Acidobacteria bacterium]|nr:ATP-binding protein [Acidobacteriota bacterium]MBU4255567.1 ATP-binding protein [Acidobacteriota bacterium]MBU4330948.1 ATP-binding protein [Acidobacteriota bacterium]